MIVYQAPDAPTLQPLIEVIDARLLGQGDRVDQREVDLLHPWGQGWRIEELNGGAVTDAANELRQSARNAVGTSDTYEHAAHMQVSTGPRSSTIKTAGTSTAQKAPTAEGLAPPSNDANPANASNSPGEFDLEPHPDTETDS